MKHIAISFIAVLGLVWFFGYAAQAETVAKISAHSGFVMHEYVFHGSCEIDSKGSMKSEYQRGMKDDGTWIYQESRSSTFGKAKIKKLVALLKLAQKEPVTNGMNPCDIGTTIVMGYVNGQEVPLKNAPDCSPTQINNSVAAKKAMALIKSICGLKQLSF